MTIETFIARCDAYCEAAGRTRAWLSKLLFGKGTKLDELASGKCDVGVRRLGLAADELSGLLRALRTTSPTPEPPSQNSDAS